MLKWDILNFSTAKCGLRPAACLRCHLETKQVCVTEPLDQIVWYCSSDVIRFLSAEELLYMQLVALVAKIDAAVSGNFVTLLRNCRSALFFGFRATQTSVAVTSRQFGPVWWHSALQGGTGAHTAAGEGGRANWRGVRERRHDATVSSGQRHRRPKQQPTLN